MENESPIQEAPIQTPALSEPILKPKKFPWIKIAIILIILAAIIPSSVLLFSKSKETKVQIQTATITPSPTPDPTANWKTYTNNELGFSIKYPKNWGEPVWPCHTNDSVCFSVRGYNTANYQEKPNIAGGAISIFRGTGNRADFCQSNSYGSIVTCDESLLNDLSAVKKVQVLNDGFNNDENRTFYIVRGKYYYQISGTFVRTDTLTEKEIDQTLSTFKFLK